MDAIAHTYAAPMMQTYPAGSSRSVNQCVKQGPVRHGVASVQHGLGLPVRGGHGAGIEMVAADDYRGLYSPGTNQLIESQSGFFAFPLTQPADTGRKPLKGDA